jgi:hypothetical protein
VEVLNDYSKASEYDVNSGSIYFNLYTYKTTADTVYLVTEHTIAGSGLGVFSIRTFTIQGGKLNKNRSFFKTKKEYLSSISYTYDLQSSGNRGKPWDYPEPKFSPSTDTLYVPLISQYDEITNRFLEYRFDGNNFVYQGITTL